MPACVNCLNREGPRKIRRWKRWRIDTEGHTRISPFVSSLPSVSTCPHMCENARVRRDVDTRLSCSPTVYRAVGSPVDRQICAFIWIVRCQGLVDVDAEARRVARVHESVLECVVVWEHAIGFLAVPHVFLNAEVVHAQIEVEGGRHTNWTQVRRAMRTGLYLIKLGQRSDFSEISDASRVHDCGSDVIDQLLLD